MNNGELKDFSFNKNTFNCQFSIFILYLPTGNFQ